MPSITVPYSNGLDYGVGVDTPSGDVRNVAVTGDKSGIPGAGGPIVTFDMTQVSTVSELNDVMGISASASGGFGLFSLSARFKWSKARQVNESSVFLVVTVQVTNPFQQIKAPGITDPASTLLSNGQIQKFQDEFGDMFVRGLVTGGVFFGVIEVQTRDSDEKTQVSVGLKGSYTAFQADGSFDENFHQTLKSRRTNVRCYVEGGEEGSSANPLPVQVDTMIDFARRWPESVKNNAVPYSAVLDTYSILPIPEEPNFIDLQHQKDVLSQCSILRDQDLTMLNNIDYILSNPDQFVTPEKFPLGQTRNDLNADLNTIAAAASNALNFPKQAALPQLKLTGPIALPQRKVGNPISLHLQWRSAAPMSTPRRSLGAATGSDGRIYALGGIIGGSDAARTGDTETVEAYNPQTNTWTAVASMSRSRFGLAAVLGPDGRIYALGGSDQGPGSIETVEAYDPQTNTWTAVASMSRPRLRLAAVAGPDGRIYALGGTGQGPSPIETVEAYDPKTNTWTAVASMSRPRDGLAAVLGPDGRIYVFGGTDQGPSPIETVEAYDPETNTWTPVAFMPHSRSADAAVLGPDGRVYLLGNDGLATVYDPRANTWTPVTSMPTVRSIGLAAAVGRDGCIYALGGLGDDDILNTVEIGCG